MINQQSFACNESEEYHYLDTHCFNYQHNVHTTPPINILLFIISCAKEEDHTLKVQYQNKSKTTTTNRTVSVAATTPINTEPPTNTLRKTNTLIL